MRGELRAVVTTDALELGIDIGELDAALVVTFPGTVASLRQMWGRAGRRGRGPGPVRGRRGRPRPVLLPPPRGLPRAPGGGRHPRPRERPDLPLAPALRRPRGAAGSRGRRVPRPALGGATPKRWRATGSCAAAGSRARSCPAGPDSYPAAEVSLRSASPESFAIVDVSSGELLGSTEAARAHSTIHEGAVYMHLGSSYEVRALELDTRRALVTPFRGDWYTQPKRDTDTEIVRLLDRREMLGVTLSFGEVSVTETVLAYQRRSLSDHAPLELIGLDLPPGSFDTQALWFELPALREAGCELPLESPARSAARHRARPDRGAAAAGDVRPLGHRGALDELPPADRQPDDLHLRRAPRRDRDREDRLHPLRGAVLRRPQADRRVPLQPAGAPRAFSPPSAETSTSRCPRPARSGCSQQLLAGDALRSAAPLVEGSAC